MNGAADQAPSTPPIPPTPSSITPNAAPPVVPKKRGRPRKTPRPEAVNRQHATEASSANDRTATAPPAERLPPSNSTSPQLANIVTDHPGNRSHGNLDVAVFPSPTPSEEDAHNNGLQIQGLGTAQPVNIDRFDFALVQSPNASNPGPAATIKSPTGQQRPLPKRPAGEVSVPMEKRVRVDTAQFPARPPTVLSPSELPTFPELSRRPSATHTQIRSPSLSQPSSRSPSLGQMTNSQMASPQLMRTTQHIGGRPSSRGYPYPLLDQYQQNGPARGLFTSPQLPAQPYGRPNSTQQSAQQPPVVPLQQLPSYHSDWYTVDKCRGELEAFRSRYPPMLRNAQDKIRLQVLEEAVLAHDWAYLTLHQYYCVMTYSPQDLPLGLQRINNLQTAHSLLQEVLDDNKQLSTAVLAFFTTFPYSVDVIGSRWPAAYQQAEYGFANFVKYSVHVGALRQVSERRRVPPIPREFVNCAITSVTFQRLLFRSIIRVLWARSPPIPEKGLLETQVMRVFNEAQAVFEHRRAVGDIGGREQAGRELQSWKQHCDMITKSLEATLQAQGLHPLYPDTPHLNQQKPQPKKVQQNQLVQQQHYQQRPNQQRPQQLNQQQQRAQIQLQQRVHTAHGFANVAMSRRSQPAPLPMTYPRPTSQVQTPSGPQGKTRLLPKVGVLQPHQRIPVPSRFALHQAHLRSPVLRAADLRAPCYYFWQGFVLQPQRLKNANTAVERLLFTLGTKDLESIAKTMPSPAGAPETRLIDEKHKMIRLRCVKWPADPMPRGEQWAVADNSWIQWSTFSLNGHPLEFRKKLHYGKDLPIDLTPLVTKGENILAVSVMSNSDDHNYRNYLIAAEFLGVMTRQSIDERLREKTVDAQTVVDDIKRKLSGSATDDDDIVLMESTLTVNLRDPFSASKICDTPVRGKTCLHNDCFDLDTFLETRPRKGDATAADQWRCPICKADARPNTLVIDGFLVEVREELARKGLLGTRAIIVSQDGSWRPKPEERDPNGVTDRDTPEPNSAAAQTVHEIIDLSD